MNEKRSICLLNDSFPPAIDGVANTVTNYARILEEDGGHAVVVTPDHPDADDRAFPFPVFRYPSLDLRRQTGYMAGFPFSYALSADLTEHKTELLHSHCPIVSTMLGRELRKALDVPLVMTYHTKFDIDIEKVIRSKRLQEGALKALVENISACDEVWVVSRGAGENLVSLGYEGDYVVMNNGVDVPRERVGEALIEKAVAGCDLPAGVPVFLFVGRIMWYKGLRMILDALSFVHAMDLDFRMVFIGDGTDRSEVMAYAGQLGLEDHCLFTGAIRDRDLIRAWYARADLFLFPSTFDTNGLVVREAAASSLASVLVRGSCASEGTTDLCNAFLVDENAGSLGACLVKLIARPEKMKEVGERASADLYVSWKDAVKLAEERYEIVIDRYRSGQMKPHRSLNELLFKGAGELMEALGDLELTRRDLERTLEAHNAQVEEKIQKAYNTFWNTLDRYL